MGDKALRTGQDSEIVLDFLLKAPSPAPHLSEIGAVAEVGDGIAIVAGLEQALSDELLQFASGVQGIVLDLEPGRLGVVLLGPSDRVTIGESVMRTHNVVSTAVGDALLGRVVNALGAPSDDKGAIRAQTVRPVEAEAPQILDRKAISRPLATGIKVIDAAVPIGLGQRQLIIGDRQTGKTSVAVDTILNQKNTDVICIYCAIGQRGDAVAKVIGAIHDGGMSERTIVLAAGDEDAAGLAYVAPYGALTMAEYFADQARDVLVILDDLTHHARSYRELSLLLRRPPGREVLSRRTSSMRGIRSIVHTMKTLSVINAAPYEHAARAIEAYHGSVLMGLHAFLSQTGPLEAAPSTAKTNVLIVFGSDHGLCGSYNETLASHVAHQLNESFQKTIVLCVGAQMADALRDLGLTPAETFFPPASVDWIGRLSNMLTRHLDDMRCDLGAGDMAVSLAYFTRDGDKGQRPEVIALLPLDRDLVHDLQVKPWASRSLPTFTMAPPALFQALIRSHLFAGMFRASAEALVTENAARLALMSQAEQSVDDRLDELLSETRSVRQSEITTELLDVIIGFEALKKNR